MAFAVEIVDSGCNSAPAGNLPVLFIERLAVAVYEEKSVLTLRAASVDTVKAAHLRTRVFRAEIAEGDILRFNRIGITPYQLAIPRVSRRIQSAYKNRRAGCRILVKVAHPYAVGMVEHIYRPKRIAVAV